MSRTNRTVATPVGPDTVAMVGTDKSKLQLAKFEDLKSGDQPN